MKQAEIVGEATVAIIGGGISGLAIAEAIERKARDRGRSVRAVVLEAERTAGGKIKSAREQGFLLESGPHGFLDKEPLVFDLIDRLGLRGSLIAASSASAKRFVVRRGVLRAIPDSPPKFLVSDVLPFGARVRVLGEPWARARPEGIEESVFEFAKRRIGRVAAEVLVDAMVTGIYGGDPKMLSLAAAFPRMVELEDRYGGLIRAQIALAREKRRASNDGGMSKRASGSPGGPAGTLHSFRDGLGELSLALARRVSLRTQFTAQRIVRRDAGDERPFRVEGTGEPVEATAVVIAVPAREAAALLSAHASEEARLIDQIPYAPIAVVVQGFRSADLGCSLDGFGFLSPHVEGRPILGSIFASTVFPEHAPEGTVMLRTMLGGARRPELAEGDDGTLLETARAELVSLTGIRPTARPVFERVIRWSRGIPQYNLGHRARVAAAEAVERRIPGLFLGGNAFRGVAMIACVVDAERVAERALSHVLGPSAPDVSRNEISS